MRKMGVSYRLIFGVDLPRLQEISRKYEPGAALAERLWSEDARELKILATLLYPPGEMNVEAANRWVEQIDNQELREQVCKNLFEKLPFANEAVENWSACEENGIRATGYWLFARLCISGSALVDKVDSVQVLQCAVADLKADSPILYQSARVRCGSLAEPAGNGRSGCCGRCRRSNLRHVRGRGRCSINSSVSLITRGDRARYSRWLAPGIAVP